MLMCIVASFRYMSKIIFSANLLKTTVCPVCRRKRQTGQIMKVFPGFNLLSGCSGRCHSHLNLHSHLFSPRRGCTILYRYLISFHENPIHLHGNNSSFHMPWILHRDMVAHAAEISGHLKSFQEIRNAWIHNQSVVIPRMYWETFRKVQAAVPVSQLFLASPKCGASFPAIICE